MKEKRERMMSDSDLQSMTKCISAILQVLMVACVSIPLCFIEDGLCRDSIQPIKNSCSASGETEESVCAKGGQIMKLNKTNVRKLSDQIIMLGQDPDFNDSFFKAVRFGLGYKSLQDALDKKRKAYNLAMVNLLDEYGINHPDIYGELDRIWAKTFVEHKIFVMGPLSDLWAKRIASFHKTWKGYLKETQKFALDLVKEQSSVENINEKESQ